MFLNRNRGKHKPHHSLAVGMAREDSEMFEMAIALEERFNITELRDALMQGFYTMREKNFSIPSFVDDCVVIKGYKKCYDSYSMELWGTLLTRFIEYFWSAESIETHPKGYNELDVVKFLSRGHKDRVLLKHVIMLMPNTLRVLRQRYEERGSTVSSCSVCDVKFAPKVPAPPIFLETILYPSF